MFRYRLKVVRRNLATSFPEKSETQLRRIERAYYRFFCDYLVESIKLLTISPEEIKRRLVFKGTEAVNQCVEEGQSCAVYLGHYWFLRLRQRLGAVCIPMQDTLRKILEFRQAHQPVVIGYISDQKPNWHNIHHWVNFLHHDTPVLTGTERIARKVNHAVFYMDVRCVRRGYYEAEFKLITREPQKMKEFEVTDIYYQHLEQSILRAPEFWLWSHNRWSRTRKEFNERFKVVDGKVVAK